jgi:hypothetical protein
MGTRGALPIVVVGILVGILAGWALVVTNGVFDAAERIGVPWAWLVVIAWIGGVPGLTAVMLWAVRSRHALAGALASAFALSLAIGAPLWANVSDESDPAVAALAAVAVFGAVLVTSAGGALVACLLLEIWTDRPG